jgi:hypothetical protein
VDSAFSPRSDAYVRTAAGWRMASRAWSQDTCVVQQPLKVREL